ncbi:MAG: hypothetical protein QM741_05910 [Rudaea sp.]|uniref:hypothetical protein n=1 Tax=Rudaea sp. TaxID=2136325 RepID=UPI0039E5B34D
MPRLAALLISLSLLAGCATPNTKGDALDATLESYAATIRWGNPEDAVAFVDPETLRQHPLTDLDRQRFRQVRISGYTAQPPRSLGDDEVALVAEIVVTNNNTQSVRSVLDRQRWRYDGKNKRWWLVTGLPDLTQR